MEQFKIDYLNKKSKQWSLSTLRSETARLKSIPTKFLPDDPEGYYSFLVSKEYKPYTIKTMMIRASELASFMGSQAFKVYLEENSRAFKNAYTPKRPAVNYETAKASILGIADEATRRTALRLLSTGLRISEASQASCADGTVTGKGGRAREVAAAPGIDVKTIASLRKELAKVGLTPHMLRKLAATKAVELGAREADLLAIFGWRSAQVASTYVQATRSKLLMQQLTQEANSDE